MSSGRRVVIVRPCCPRLGRPHIGAVTRTMPCDDSTMEFARSCVQGQLGGLAGSVNTEAMGQARTTFHYPSMMILPPIRASALRLDDRAG